MKADDKLEQELVSCTAQSLFEDGESRVYRRLEIVAELLRDLKPRLLPDRPCLLYRWNDQIELVAMPAKPGWFTVGREQGDLILKEPTVSRMHFRLRWENGGVSIEDRGSRHHTRVNGEKLAGTRRLCDGDIIHAGRQLLVFLLDSAGPPESTNIEGPKRR
jgi:hypothetical protein